MVVELLKLRALIRVTRILQPDRMQAEALPGLGKLASARVDQTDPHQTLSKALLRLLERERSLLLADTVDEVGGVSDHAWRPCSRLRARRETPSVPQIAVTPFPAFQPMHPQRHARSHEREKGRCRVL